MRSCKSRKKTAQTALVAAGVQRIANDWEDLTPAQRQAWSDYARFLTRTNRLGVSRNMSGRQAQTEFLLRTDPYARGGIAAIVPPTHGRSPTPSIASCAWSASGSQTITFDFTGLTYSKVQLYGQQHYQYGPRAAAGCLAYFGNLALTVNPLNWTTTLATFGITIYEGEQIRLRMHLTRADYFPSFSTFHTLTVSA